MANMAAVDAQPATVEEEEAEVNNASELAVSEAAITPAEREVSNYKSKGSINGVYVPGNGNGHQQHNYNGNGNGGYHRGYGFGHEQVYNGNDGFNQRHCYNGNINGGYYRGYGNVHQQIYIGNAIYRTSGNGNHYNYYNFNGSGGYGQAYNYNAYQQQELYGHREVYHDQRQQVGGSQYYYNIRQGYREGNDKRHMSQLKNTAESEAQKPEEQVVVSPSETVQKASAVNGDAAPASISENSTGDAADGEGGTPQKRFVGKVKLSGSQKRKLKKKGADNELGKAKQDPVIPKEHISTEQKTYCMEAKKMTLDEYEKVREEKKKSHEMTTTGVRNVSVEEFQGLQLLEKKTEQEATNEAKSKPREKLEIKPDSKMVANALFRPPPRPRRDQGFSNQYYRRDEAHRDNSTDYQSSGRGEYGRSAQHVAGNNGNGYSNDRRGGYSGGGNARFHSGYNNGHQGGYSNSSNGNGFYQERAGVFRGRGNDRVPQRGFSDDPNRANEIFNANFPALSRTAVAPAPASIPAPGPVPASLSNN